MKNRIKFYISIFLIFNLLITGLSAQNSFPNKYTESLEKARLELEQIMQELAAIEQEEKTALSEKNSADKSLYEKNRLYAEKTERAKELTSILKNDIFDLENQKEKLEQVSKEAELVEKEAQKEAEIKTQADLKKEEKKKKLLEDWIIETDEKNDFTQKLSWKKDPNVFEYIVEIYSISEGKMINSFTTEDSSVAFSIPAGKYQFRVSACDFLGRVSASSEWRNFEITKARKPNISLKENNIEVTSNKSKVEVPVKTSDVSPESEVTIINSEGKEIKGKLKTDSSEGAKAVFENVDEGFWKLKVTNPGGLSAVTDIVDVYQKNERVINVEKAVSAKKEQENVVSDLTGKIQNNQSELQEVKKQQSTALTEKKAAQKSVEAADKNLAVVKEKKTAVMTKIQKAQEKIQKETEKYTAYEDELRKKQEAENERQRLLAQEAEKKRLEEENRRIREEEEKKRLAREKADREEAEKLEAERIAKQKAAEEEEAHRRLEEEQELARLEEERLEKERLEEEEKLRIAKEQEEAEKAAKKELQEQKKIALGRNHSDINIGIALISPISLYDGELFSYNRSNFTMGVGPKIIWLPAKTKTRRNKLGFEFFAHYSSLGMNNDFLKVNLPFFEYGMNLAYQFALVKDHFMINVKGGAGLFVIEKNITYTKGYRSKNYSRMYAFMQAQGGASLFIRPAGHLGIDLGADFTHVFIDDMPTGMIIPYVCMGVWF